MDAVVRLTKGDAGQAVGDEAGVDGVEAVEEAGEPAAGALRGLGVDVLARAREDVVEAVLPGVEVGGVDGAAAVLLTSVDGLLILGAHLV